MRAIIEKLLSGMQAPAIKPEMQGRVLENMAESGALCDVIHAIDAARIETIHLEKLGAM